MKVGTPCESFITETHLDNLKCPDCKRLVEKIKEQCYFFKLSKYQEKLLKYIEENENFIQPINRREEIINIIKTGLKDLSISRKTTKWGIPVPFDKEQVIYVWFDALLNYISAPCFMEDNDKFNKIWPADVHLIGKDILKFHTIIWPIILFALDLKPPKSVLAHGWWLVGENKMSKSLGNVINPNTLLDEFGQDAYRYFLLREIPFSVDGTFSRESFISRINGDLANDLGNLVNRSLTMVKKYFDGYIPTKNQDEKIDIELKNKGKEIIKEITLLMEKISLQEVLIKIWEFIRKVNKYIDDISPWTLFKFSNKKRLETVMYNLVDSLYIISALIYPFIPETAIKIRNQIGTTTKITYHDFEFGNLISNTKIGNVEPLFPRINK